MTNQKQAKEILIEKIAYEQFSREQLDDFLAKLFLLEQFLETYNSDLRNKLEEVTKERDELMEACSVLHDIKWQLENSEMDMSDISQFTNEIYHACDILTKTKEVL